MIYLGNNKLKNICINNIFQKDFKIGDNYLFEEKKTISGSEVASVILPAVITNETAINLSGIGVTYPSNSTFTTPSTLLLLNCSASYSVGEYSTKSKYYCDSFILCFLKKMSSTYMGCNATIYLRGSLTNNIKIQIEIIGSSSSLGLQSYYIYDNEGLLETFIDQPARKFILISKSRNNKQISFSIPTTEISKTIDLYDKDEPFYIEIIQKHTSTYQDDYCYIGNINYIDDIAQINS